MSERKTSVFLTDCDMRHIRQIERSKWDLVARILGFDSYEELDAEGYGIALDLASGRAELRRSRDRVTYRTLSN